MTIFWSFMSKLYCLQHWVSSAEMISCTLLCFLSWALQRTVWAASVSGLFGSVCTMTVWYLNKFCKCKHTEQLLYTKDLSPGLRAQPSLAAGPNYGYLWWCEYKQTPRPLPSHQNPTINTHRHTHLDTLSQLFLLAEDTQTQLESTESLWF